MGRRNATTIDGVNAKLLDKHVMEKRAKDTFIFFGLYDLDECDMKQRIRSDIFPLDFWIVLDVAADVGQMAADFSAATCLATLQGHSKTVLSVAFHPSAPLLATGSDDNSAKLWR
jgi:WD40 repeat protein